ncbi:NADPH-dependent FMN reductase [Streptomyces sp. NPDC088725]|uniref:NADPH-dependent FMN reductase n=1 Tax=Streptomyces sp. NPDC088725 TaxID=3365873 RepID=UPI00381B4962
MDVVNVLAISGSLRAGSFNTAVLRAAQKHAPAGMNIHLYERLADVPPYNQDLDGTEPPEPVADLRSSIARADGLLIASPEYNYSVPGVLKNALDWASRPTTGSSLAGKPVALTGASPGNFGTARGQMALRQVLLGTRSHVLARPELMVFGAHQRLDDAGHVNDETTLTFLREFLEAFRDEIRQRTP